MLIISIPNAVADDGGVSETIFVVFVDEVFLIFGPTLRSVFLRFQDVSQLTGFMRFFECSLSEERSFDFFVTELFVAVDYDLADSFLLFFIDFNV